MVCEGKRQNRRVGCAVCLSNLHMTLKNPDGSIACICHEHRPACDCLASVAPVTTKLNDSQLRLVRLLQRSHDYVETWRHVFKGGTILAKTAQGKTASVSKDDVDDMISFGLLASGWGGSYYLTEKGKAI